MKDKMRLVYVGLAAIVVWFGLGLQFYISTQLYMSQGRTFAGAIIQIISYFTVLTNILVASAFSCILLNPNSKPGNFFLRTSTLTAIAVYITIVGCIYNLILSNQWNPQGLFKLADTLLHTISPILFIIFWLVFVSKEKLRWILAIKWLWFPFCYLVYSIIRGQVLGVYPYFFMDIGVLGYKQTIINCLFVLLAFVSFSGLFLFISRLLSSSSTKK
jgi:hypothetical protein